MKNKTYITEGIKKAARFVHFYKGKTIKPPTLPLNKKGGCKSTKLIGNMQGCGC